MRYHSVITCPFTLGAAWREQTYSWVSRRAFVDAYGAVIDMARVLSKSYSRHCRLRACFEFLRVLRHTYVLGKHRPSADE